MDISSPPPLTTITFHEWDQIDVENHSEQNLIEPLPSLLKQSLMKMAKDQDLTVERCISFLFHK